ncbi:uncharacterized protein LOC132059045 isoform X2 [Lycium ferocissimum]|uniref:uncharacterized protein LOC132059045 isoform X2 n=1 Tax=Lycium ferocissimum TaxID=112874 RepID=UPI002815D03A|nr:uncharacterized protein LOC132059045 isoform X2 [Lycium ferocissimum]
MEVGRFAVIFRAMGDNEDMFYRVELENTLGGRRKLKKGDRKTISPFALLSHERFGRAGSWDIIGDDIYWIGGIKLNSEGMTRVCNELIKHNMTSDDPTVWETVSSSMKIPRASPFFTAVGGKKLYAVLGTAYRPPDEDEELAPDWDRCGEVYDIQDKTWHYLDPDVEDFYDYDPFDAAFVKGENGEPTDIVFYDPPQRPLMFFNFHSKTLRFAPDPSSSFAGWFSHPDSPPLFHAINNLKTVFHNNTFYWFARDLRLYGYDIVSQTWSVSPSLKDRCPTLQFRPYSPILIGLGNGKFVVILDEPIHPPSLSFTMAFLAVQKQQDSCIFSVSVESLQAFSLDNHPLPFFDAKKVEEYWVRHRARTAKDRED